MTIDETIAREREKAKEIRENIIDEKNLEPYESYCIAMAAKCAEEHEQRAEWLEELKDHRERECNHINEALYDKGYSDGYNKAIEYFVMLFKSKTSMENSLVDEIAEQLKAGGENA